VKANTAASWGSVSRLLHWLTVLLILVQIPLGFYMVEVYEVYKQTYEDDTMLMRTSMVHHTLGFIILMVATARLGWRVSQPTPGLPESLSRFKRVLARLTHTFLYALLIIYPLSGWAALSAYEFEFPIFFFGWDAMPGIVPSVKEGSGFDYPFFADIHRLCWRVGAGLLALHVVAAVWHHHVAKDGLLMRMWRGEPK